MARTKAERIAAQKPRQGSTVLVPAWASRASLSSHAAPNLLVHSTANSLVLFTASWHLAHACTANAVQAIRGRSDQAQRRHLDCEHDSARRSCHAVWARSVGDGCTGDLNIREDGNGQAGGSCVIQARLVVIDRHRLFAPRGWLLTRTCPGQRRCGCLGG